VEDWTLLPGCQPATSKLLLIKIGNWKLEKDRDGINKSRQETVSSRTFWTNGYSKTSPSGVLD